LFFFLCFFFYKKHLLALFLSIISQLINYLPDRTEFANSMKAFKGLFGAFEISLCLFLCLSFEFVRSISTAWAALFLEVVTCITAEDLSSVFFLMAWVAVPGVLN